MQSSHGPARLEMRGIAKRFGATTALAGVDLSVKSGEIHALIGENGAGKSTLTKILAGAERADSGEMALDGERYAPTSPIDARAAGVAMIYQELSLAPHLSIAENISLGREPTRGLLLDRGELDRRARAALQLVGRGELDVRTRVMQLSPADRQLVEIARSIASSARVIVLDEPTSSLGRADVEHLLALMRDQRARGTAVVYISHVLEEVSAIADSYTVLRDGVPVASGSMAAASVESLAAAMVGRGVTHLYTRSPAHPGEVVASLASVAGSRLPRDATLELRRGEVLGIAGLIGAGRTELMRAIFGLDSVVRGELRVLALAGARTPSERWRQGVGMASEDRKREGLAVARSVAENTCLPRLDKVASAAWLTRGALATSTQPWIERLRIKCSSPHQAVAQLSGGNQQKIALARLLFADVDVLLLDEPTRGIDIGAKSEIYDLIDELAHRAARPRAILMISSHLPELFGVCDRIAVMARGRLGPARPVAELDERAVMLEAAVGA